MTTQWDTPRTPHALHEFIETSLGACLVRQVMVPGHQAPFDYITHAFFEGRGVLDERGGASPWRDPAPAPTHPPDVVLWANRGGGKTFLGALATTLDMLFKPGIEVRILAGSLEQASRMLAHLRRFFSIPDLSARVEGRPTQKRITLKNRSTVEILSASHASVRGTRVQKLRCDEVDLFDPELWEAAQLTTRSERLGEFDVRGAVECLSTMHRPHGLMFNLVKDATTGARRLFKWGVLDALEACDHERACGRCALEPECRGRAKVVAVRLGGVALEDQGSRAFGPPGDGALRIPYENNGHAAGGTPTAPGERQGPMAGGTPATPGDDRGPRDAGHISIDDAITLKSRVSQSAWESEMLCLRPSRSHAVYPEFDHAVHVVDDVPRAGVTWVGGMDFGFRALTVVLWGVLDGSGVLWIAGEHARAGSVMAEHVEAITSAPGERGLERPSWIGIDPAGRQRNDQTGMSNADVLGHAGLAVRSRGSSLGEGIALVRARLSPASGGVRLRIHRECSVLIESLERYHYPEDDPESMTPVKDGPDHAVDALRYLVLNLDKRTICQSATYDGRSV